MNATHVGHLDSCWVGKSEKTTGATRPAKESDARLPLAAGGGGLRVKTHFPRLGQKASSGVSGIDVMSFAPTGWSHLPLGFVIFVGLLLGSGRTAF